ncbi:HET-domain-containing protein [Hypoxylon trugodes]|uniref:HET-domain-containing protein n=1 Tax=Hypoxylon trugodes TaxID=326681 RepID=UPI00219A61C2|nr:HET-domain-containing protein [Hypoxylon trugodes]KAI1391858.1 HET-domain-containing protein [Hypoxylon trugodes]
MDDDLDKILNRKAGFIYPAIYAETEVRLMRFPANRRNPSDMRYTLETFQLSDLPSTRYKALSYTWGRANVISDLHEILLDGQQFFIRKNLFEFLTIAAGKGETGLFFVDAICINQLDKAERLFQVREMARVYRNADKVVAWLGIPNTQRTLNDVQSLAEIKDRTGCAGWTSNQWDAFKYLSFHPYWSRIWIVQEVILAPSMEVWCWYFVFPLALFVGTPQYSLPFRDTTSSKRERLRTVNNEIYTHCSPADRVTTHRTRLVNLLKRDPLAQGTAVGTLEEMTTSLTMPYMKAETYQSTVPDLVHEIVPKFGMFQCSDPRDKLYGFLGILKDSSRAEVNPDYTMSVTYAFRQALKIGFREIEHEHSATADIKNSDEIFRLCLAYYCAAHSVFGIEDYESIVIIQEVVAELRKQAPLTSFTDRIGSRRPSIWNDINPEIVLDPEKLLQMVAPKRDVWVKSVCSYRIRLRDILKIRGITCIGR